METIQFNIKVNQPSVEHVCKACKQSQKGMAEAQEA